MAEDKTSLTDEFVVEMNPIEGESEKRSPQLPAIPERPDEDADRSEWVGYVVSLGADETFVNEETTHTSEKHGGRVTVPSLDKATLIKLADHLGNS